MKVFNKILDTQKRRTKSLYNDALDHSIIHLMLWNYSICSFDLKSAGVESEAYFKKSANICHFSIIRRRSRRGGVGGGGWFSGTSSGCRVTRCWTTASLLSMRITNYRLQGNATSIRRLLLRAPGGHSSIAILG